MELKGRSAVISGGAGGLGAATSRRLAQLGVGVVIFDPNGANAEALAKDIGAKAVALAGDQNSDADVAEAIAAAKALGTFSIAVNAAGVAIPTPSVATPDGVPHDMDIFKEMIGMHVFGPFNVARLSAAAFAANAPDADGQRGVIVNTASTGAYEGQAKQVAYAAAKAGIAGMTLAMARDLSEIGVQVNAIAPGPIKTPRFDRAPPEFQSKMIENIPFPKRLGHAEEYATLVEMIVRTPFLNGQTIRLDGALATPLMAMSPAHKG